MTTYIIGNGFDIAHSLDTSFESFKLYLENKQSYLLYLFDGEDYWHDFEKNMCSVDHEGYRWAQDMSKGIPYFVDSLFDDICDELCLFLNSKNYKCKRMFSFEKNDLFLNFNYTPTLVDTYDVDINNIYYIHGSLYEKRLDSNSNLILGHDEFDYETNPNLLSYKYQREYLEFIDYTIKPYRYIMESNKFQSFLAKINDSDRVVVYGLSYASVDMNYLKYIFENVDKSIKAIFYYYNDDDLIRLNAFIKENIKNRKYEIICCKGDIYNEKRL